MIRILIADDHAIVRGGLKQIMATTTDIEVAGEAAQGVEVIEKLRSCCVDLLLLDMTMPGISGVDLIRRTRTGYPALPVLVLSIHNEAQVVARAVRAGATGYVTKDSDPTSCLPPFASSPVADGSSIRSWSTSWSSIPIPAAPRRTRFCPTVSSRCCIFWRRARVSMR